MKKSFYDVNDAGKMFLWAVVAPQLVATLIYLLIIIIANLAGMFVDEVYGLFEDLYILSMITQFALGLVLIFCNKKIDVVKSCKINKLGWRNLIICIVLGVVGVFALNPISNCFVWLFEVIGLNFSSAMPFEPSGAFTLILAVILFALVPAIIEELVFRGAVLQGLRKFGDLKAILISSALFALIHGNFLQIPYTFLFGLLLAFVVLKTGSILSSMIIHFCANALTVVFYNFNIFNGEITINFVYWLIAIVILVMFGLLVFYLGKVLQNKDKSLNANQLLDEINKINSFKNDEKVSKEEELLKLFEEIQELEKSKMQNEISTSVNVRQSDNKNNSIDKDNVLDKEDNLSNKKSYISNQENITILAKNEKTTEMIEKLKELSSSEFKPNNNTYFLKSGIILGIIILILQTILMSF